MSIDYDQLNQIIELNEKFPIRKPYNPVFRGLGTADGAGFLEPFKTYKFNTVQYSFGMENGMINLDTTEYTKILPKFAPKEAQVFRFIFEVEQTTLEKNKWSADQGNESAIKNMEVMLDRIALEGRVQATDPVFTQGINSISTLETPTIDADVNSYYNMISSKLKTMQAEFGEANADYVLILPIDFADGLIAVPNQSLTAENWLTSNLEASYNKNGNTLEIRYSTYLSGKNTLYVLRKDQIVECFGVYPALLEYKPGSLVADTHKWFYGFDTVHFSKIDNGNVCYRIAYNLTTRKGK